MRVTGHPYRAFAEGADLTAEPQAQGKPMAKRKRRPYESAGRCPECGESALEQTAGRVDCRECEWGVDLRDFPMPNATGYYVGSDGEAYSVHKGFRRMGRKQNRGFVRVKLSIDGQEYYPYLAPAVLTAFSRPRPPGYEVDHADGDRANCRPDNLSWKFKRSPQISAKQFVAAWQRAQSVDEVADLLGVDAQTAYQRAWRLRNSGVPLKDLSRGSGKRLDYDELAELARSLNGESE